MGGKLAPSLSEVTVDAEKAKEKEAEEEERRQAELKRKREDKKDDKRQRIIEYEKVMQRKKEAEAIAAAVSARAKRGAAGDDRLEYWRIPCVYQFDLIRFLGSSYHGTSSAVLESDCTLVLTAVR